MLLICLLEHLVIHQGYFRLVELIVLNVGLSAGVLTQVSTQA